MPAKPKKPQSPQDLLTTLGRPLEITKLGQYLENQGLLLEETNINLANMQQELVQTREATREMADAVQKLVGYMKRSQPAYIQWPRSGGTSALPAGDTQFDLIEGNVILGDGSEDKMTTNLRSLKDESCHSFWIWADNDIEVGTDTNPKRKIQRQKDFLATYQDFERIIVSCTTSTQIAIWAATAADPRYGGFPNPKTARIKRFKTSKDLSAGALSYATTFTTPFKLTSILCKFSAAVSPTFTVDLDSKDGSSYDTRLFTPSVAAAQNVAIICDEDGYEFEQGDQIQVDITSVAAIAYLTVVGEEI